MNSNAQYVEGMTNSNDYRNQSMTEALSKQNNKSSMLHKDYGKYLSSTNYTYPQIAIKLPKRSSQTKTVSYDPVKFAALKQALMKPKAPKSGMEIFAENLANIPEAQGFKGGFGEDIYNPYGLILGGLARGFGQGYSQRKAAEREAADRQDELALKLAQLDYENSKRENLFKEEDEIKTLNQGSRGTGYSYHVIDENNNVIDTTTGEKVGSVEEMKNGEGESVRMRVGVDDKAGNGNGTAQTPEQRVANAVERESAAITAADVWNTVDQHPNQFSQLAYYTYGAFPGDDAKRRGWVSQQAPLIGGVELEKLQKMMPKGFSGAINTAAEQKLMMPVREALNSGIGSKIKPAIETYLGGYYDELQVEYAMETGGARLPFSKEEFIRDQLTTNAREYNTDYDPSNPNQPMFKPVNRSVDQNAQSAEAQQTQAPVPQKNYGGTRTNDGYAW